MNIPFYSFQKIHADTGNEISESIQRCIAEAHFISGKDVEEFEKEYAAFNSVKHCIGTGNGLEAIHLSLKAIGIKPGDEVIVPAHTFIATYLAVSYCGAIPVPVDADPDTMNIDVTKIEAKINSKTKAILPVHLYGQSCQMDMIMKISNDRSIPVVEDNAQSQGALFKGQITGSFGLSNSTSFYPGKNIGALGDAGGITTNDESIAKKIRMLRNYGSVEKYKHEVIGFNSRLDTIQAAALRIKLKHLAKWNLERNELAQKYTSLLEKVNGITLPKIHSDAISVYHQYVIRTEKRDELKNYLQNKGIGTLIHYPLPSYLQPAYADLNYKEGSFPVTEKICKSCLSLPIFPGLTTEQIEYIANMINDFVSHE